MSLKDYITKGIMTSVLAASMVLYGCDSYPKKLEDRIKHEQARTDNSSQKFAVILGGRRSDTPLAILDAYTLLQNLNFEKENIYILKAPGYESYTPWDGWSDNVSMDSVFSHLSRKIRDNDQLLVYISAHGDRSILHNWNGEISTEYLVELSDFICLTDKELKEKLDKVHAKEIVVLTDACYSGGFTNTFSNGKYIGISSTMEDRVAIGSIADNFGTNFLNALSLFDTTSYRNKGRSFKEALNFVQSTDSLVIEHYNIPQLKSELNLDSLKLN